VAFAQWLLSGAALGSIYSLVAFGYAITWITSRTMNFSQGQAVMLGAVLAWTALNRLGWPLPLAALAAVALMVPFGLLVERFAVRPFRRTGPTWLISTVALGILLENAVLALFGKDVQPFPALVGERPIQILGAGVYPQELLIPVAVLALMGGFEFLQRRTVVGHEMQAVAYDETTATLMGIPAERVIALGYVLASVLAAIGGVIVAPVTFVSAPMGTVIGLKGFVVAILGGLDSPRGIAVAGLLYGVLEQAVSALIGTGARDAVGFALAILVLALKPSGLLGRAAVRQV
jgi:branched-chain amino acid transport system permease protein